ncbi:MAG: imidazolonepropionase, partial [Parvibaculaceae bacterium]
MAEGRPYGLIADGAVLVEDGRIAWAGARRDAPNAEAGQDVDCGGRLLTPGLIDCHTHLIYGGNRANEFEQRLNGVAYADIAKAGGGILSTVRATRQAGEDELARSAALRLQSLLVEGVTTIEIKSGYGLDVETELKMLRVARRLGEHHPVTVVTSYLGAHTFPAEYRDDHAAYVDLVCARALPAVAEAGLADAVDAFCEGIAFSVA